MNLKKNFSFIGLFFLVLGTSFFVSLRAEEVSLAAYSYGSELQAMRKYMKQWEKLTGHKAKVVTMPASTTDIFAQYRIWLSAKNSDIDVYLVDVIWAPQMDSHFVDLTKALGKDAKNFFPSILSSQKVKGRLVSIPFYTDMGVLYYRKDLLDKYGKKIPTTWKELKKIAKEIQTAERKAGNSKMYGFVFQGSFYEGLTCDALEWISSYGSAPIVDAKGNIVINNKSAIEAVDFMASFVGDISPRGVLSYKEDESRGIWQIGNAVFMRNWPYAYGLGNSENSPIKGKFGVVPLPKGEGENAIRTTALGGWNLSVSKYSKKQKAAIDLVKYLTSKKVQRDNAIHFSKLPVRPELYKDKAVLKANPFFGKMIGALSNAVPRPSQVTRKKYNEVSKNFWTSVHSVLSGKSDAKKAFSRLEKRLKRVKGRKGW